MDKDVKVLLNKLLKDPDFKVAIENNDWTFVLVTSNKRTPAPETEGKFIDWLVSNDIEFCSYMEKAPSRCFAFSTLLKEADLKKCTKLESRCFRKSKIETIILSKDNLKDLDVGIISGVENPVTIIWDGKCEDWYRLRKNSNAWYNYTGTVTIKCIDETVTEDHTFN